MRAAVVTAVLLGALMFVQHSEAGFLDVYCPNITVACHEMEDEGWVRMDENRCVKAFDTHLTFEDAEKACNEYKSGGNDTGHLVSIHNLDDLDQVVCAMYRLTPDKPLYWIGLYLSFHYEDYLVYDWTDATDHDFNRFAYLQPDFMDEEEKCVVINWNYWGQWNDIRCDEPRGYVCVGNAAVDTKG